VGLGESFLFGRFLTPPVDQDIGGMKMRIKYHREADRKKLVVAAAEQLGVSPTYAGAPTMNYPPG